MGMRSSDFSEKWHVTKSEVLYWTKIGVLHPNVMDNGYNDYGEEADDDMEKIMIALALDWPGSLKERIEKMDAYDTQKWRKIANELEAKNNDMSYQFNVARFAVNKAIERGDW